MHHTREQLIHLLTEAAELEHNLLCSYLYAAFSLKRGPEEGLTPREAEAVGRWRRLVAGVAVEEMGHLAIVNNLLVAVGGAPHFDRPNLPVAPGYHPSGFAVRLTPFDEATLDHFIFLERPEDAPLLDGAGFAPEAAHGRETPFVRLTPSAEDYATVGAFYGSIRAALTSLAARRGEAALVDPRGRGQLGPDIVDLPGLALITDLPSVTAALDAIVEQGEGSPGERGDSHFARFREIRREWAGLKALNPRFEPAHPAAHDPVMRRPADPDRRVWITAPEAAVRLDLANAIYGQTLALLAQAYAPSLADGLRAAFADAALGLMRAVSALGGALARLPAGAGHPGVNAGMSFAVPRNLGARAAGAAGALVLERLEELAEGYARVLGGRPEDPVAEALRRLREALRAASS